MLFGMITGMEGRGGIRPHDHPESMPKEKLAPLYIRGRGIIGESKDLVKVYDIMHRVFRNVLLPKVGIKMKSMAILLT